MQGHLDGISTLGRTHTSQLDALQARGLINTMATILGDLDRTCEMFNEQSNGFIGSDSVMSYSQQHVTHEIQELGQRIHIHSKTQDEKIREAKIISQDELKRRVSDRLRHDITEYIRSEIVVQVRQQVDVQIQDYIPLSLAQQALDNKTQLEEIQISLRNSEARIQNSSIQPADQDEPLAPILKADGTISNLYPADLRSLFSYESEVARILMREYDLREEELFEMNLNHFMRHIGVEFELVVTVIKL